MTTPAPPRSESLSMQDRLHRLVSDLCARRFPGSLVVTRSASLVLIVPMAAPDEDAPAAASSRPWRRSAT